MDTYNDFINSLKRLITNGRIDQDKIEKLLRNGKISQEEFEYIIMREEG